MATPAGILHVNLPRYKLFTFQQPNGGGQQQQQPEVQLIRLTKANSGMGLSIVAAKGVGKDKLGIYIKAVVEGGAAFHDGRLQAGDQVKAVCL